MSSKLLIKNGRLVDPSTNTDLESDVLIDQGKISKIDKNIDGDGCKVIEAAGCLVSPGLIDLHTHLREPGGEDKETIESGTAAAASGGFTTVTAMPNTNPVIDNRSVIEFIKKKASALSVNVAVAGSITKNLDGKELAPMSEMLKAGTVIFTDDGRSIQNAVLMSKAMEYASGLGVTIMLHCQDEALSAGGVMNESPLSTKLGLKGMPSEAEEISIARDIMLAKRASCKIHITHVSTAGGLELIRVAKSSGVKVTCDVTPHHFSLTEDELIEYDSNFKINPPLRRETDRIALIDGLKDGTVDAIATDHAPHAAHEKECEFDFAQFGTIGLETALSTAVSYLFKCNHLSIMQIINKLSTEPARILNLEKPAIEIGRSANLVIFDTESQWAVKKENIVSKSKNSAFLNKTLSGLVKATIINGVIAYER